MSRKIVTNILKLAAQEGAEHLTISRQMFKVALDCHLPSGQIRSFTLPKKLEQTFFSSLERILAIAPGDLVSQKYCELSDKDGSLKYYLTVLPDGDKERIVINLINRQDALISLNQLGLQTDDLRDLKKALRLRSGLIVVSSPPGGGKSTTLYSLLLALNNPELNIYLLDKNSRLSIPGLNRMEANLTNWEKIMHHDSDIIGVDSLDEDWALKNALLAANSGRLVIGTMASDSTQEVLDKISRIDLPEKLKKDAVKLISNQRLTDLKRSSAKTRNQRKKIALFETLKLSPESGFKPLETDRRQKIKDGLI